MEELDNRFDYLKKMIKDWNIIEVYYLKGGFKIMELTVDRLAYIAKRFDKLIRPTSFPVAIKLYKSKKELEDVRDPKGRPIRQVTDKNLTICQLIGQARYLGLVKAAAKDSASMCMYGAAVMGFEELPKEYMHGYVRSYFTDEEVAERNFATTPMFNVGDYEALLVAPLDKMFVVPDVVLLFGNTAQVYRLFHGYNYNKGVRLEFSTNGEAGMCADAIALPMQTKKPCIALPCNGARLLSWPSDNELAFAMPAGTVEDILEGLEFTHKGMIRYPLTWVHLDWEPPMMSIIRNAMSGKGFFPPEQRNVKKG